MKQFVILVSIFLCLPCLLWTLDYGLYVYSDTSDLIYILDRGNMDYLGIYDLHGGRANAFLPTPGGVSVYVLNESELRVFSAESAVPEAEFSDGWLSIVSFAFTPRGERLFILDKGLNQLLVYQHMRLNLERISTLDFPVGESGNIVFNRRGTRYFALGREDGNSLLISGDGLQGRILSSLELHFDAERLVINANDRFAWVAGSDLLAVIDLRKDKIKQKISGSFNPESLSIEMHGNKVVILNGSNNAVLAFNNQTGRKILTSSISSGYHDIIVDDSDAFWLVPEWGIQPFLQLEFDARKIKTEPVKVNIPTDISISQAVMSSVKRGENFACF